MRDALERLRRRRRGEARVLERGRLVGVLPRETASLAIGHGLDHLTARDLALDRPRSASRRRAAAAPGAALPEEQLEILRLAARIARERGRRVYLVGGRVRDLLLGRDSRDLDLAVEGDARGLAEELAGSLAGRARFHAEFGTTLIRLAGGLRVDVAATRAESYPHPGRLPEVRPATLRRDLARRDFTVNAMALVLGVRGPGRLIDPHGGVADLAARCIRVLHGLSLIEDPTRAFRAVQLAARLDFRISPATLRLIGVALREGLFGRLSAARLRREVEHLLEEPPPVRTVRMLETTGLLGVLDPALRASAETLAPLRRVQTLLTRQRRRHPVDDVRGWIVRLALLGSTLPPERRVELAERLRPERRERARLASALEHARLAERLGRPQALRPSSLHAACAGLPTETLLAAAAGSPGAVVERRVIEFLDQLRDVRADVTGDELLRAGLPPGPAIGRALRAALRVKLDRDADHEAQRAAALRAAASA